VAVLKFRGKLVAVKVAESHAVRHQLMTPQQQQESTAGMLATIGIPAATGMRALSQVHKQEKTQPQQQKRHQHQDLCGKAIKVAGNEARNMAVNVAKKKKFGGR
jgi:hypothetical protein